MGIIYASNKQVDGIWYDFNESNKTATVTYRGSSYINFDDEYSGSVVIPPSVTYNGVTYSVTSIRDCAFRECSSLTSVTIPNSVTSIGAAAFRDCSSLTSVTIGNSVTSIGEWAFKDCYKLKSITINSDAIVNKAYTSSDNLSDIFGSQVTKYIIGDNVKGIGDYAFYWCSLTSITIPNSIASIGDYAFQYCSSLTSVILTALSEEEFCKGQGNSLLFSKGVKTCQREIQINGTKVTKFTIPNSVISIGELAFASCSSLTSVTIPNSVTSIGNSAFWCCSSLTSITIPNSVTSIENKAFYSCSSLTSVTIPNSVTSIEDDTFYNCSSLTSVTIPNSVTSIGNSAFRDCSSLTSITIPNSVTSIGYDAFWSCSSLTSITIPNSVTSIGNSAFSDCSSLTSITIPNSVTSIGYGAFLECSSLTSVTIPNSVTSIGEAAFHECSSLISITCKATTPPTVGLHAFYGVSKSIPVHVPCGCVEAYKAANRWKDFTNIQGPLAEYSITVGVNATKMGTAKVDINNACGTQISAKPNIGYHFVQWSDGVVNNPRSIVLTQDTVLIAEFAEIPSYVVEVIYNTDHGTVNGQGTYKEDEEVTLTATANDGYKFHKWSDGVTDNPYTFIAKSDVTLEAKFTSTEGIADVLSSEVHTTKVLRNGQVFILRNGKTYTMQGQEVK